VSGLVRKEIDRRTAIKWMTGMAATVVTVGITGREAGAELAAPAADATGTWPNLDLTPITGPGYGTDPDLVRPKTLWPLTLSEAEKRLIDQLADIICPADEGGPSAVAVGVTAVIDEWVSAPYESQQADRLLIVPGLVWINEEAQRRFGKDFGQASDAQRLNLIDDIAWWGDPTPDELHMPKRFFDKLRQLVLGAYFSSPEGVKDIGYLGNMPISGPWPGPSREAVLHLNGVLESLGFEPEPLPAG
jgi:hypothetical protein